MNSSRTSTASAAAVLDPRRRRVILLASSIALMAVVASVSGLNVAQPQLATTFQVGHGTVLWVINTYTLTLAALLLPLGALGDRRGRKPVLLAGLALFGVANLMAALAPSVEMMIAARLLSGVGAALIMPVTLSVITASFPDGERSKAIGVWTAVAGGGGILGMYLSALLVDVATWRWLFALPVVLTLTAAAVTVRSVPNSREAVTSRFDLPGAAASVVTVITLTYALHEAPALGWGHPRMLALLGVAALAGVTFVLRELRTAAPLLDLRYFRTRGLSSGSTLLLVLFGVQAGVSLVLYPFFQVVLGWSGLVSTLALMPLALLMMVASGLAPRVAARVGARTAMAAGLVVAASGLALMAVVVSADGGYLTVLPGLVALGLGSGLAMTPSTEAITSSLPREQQGVASAVNDLTRELGAALGIALLGGVLTAGYHAAVSGRLAGVPEAVAGPARDGIATAAVAAEGAGAHAEQVLTAAQEAFVAGWQRAMWVGVAALVVVLALTVLRGPERRTPGDTAPATSPVEPAAVPPVE